MQTEEAKTLFGALKITTVLDLALIVPVAYNDTTLSTRLEPGKRHTLHVVVTDVAQQSGRLQVTCLLPKFGRKVRAVFFHATPYHYRLFTPGSHHYIQGKLEQYHGHLQLPQPKTIQTVGTVVPRYKTVIKQAAMRTLVQTFVTEKNLYDAGLESTEVAALMQLHFPDARASLYPAGSLKPAIIQALKRVEAYNHLAKLKGKRIDFPAMAALEGAIEPFVASLPFALTDQQREVIAAIRHDVSRADKAAKRMIVGDVGSGKTMVILAAAMMALPHTSILMAPTSLLAMQLYEEATRYLPSHVRIARVMQGANRGDYREADLIIGTHALLHRDDLPSAPLVMVDEQHRFGTAQRARLEARMGSGERKPHFLQFSATPIPRTQAMMESALVDVSLITTTPFARTVTTEVIGRSDFSQLLTHIEDEIAHDHQVLIVYPLVEQSSEVPYQSLEEARGYWEKRFDAVYVTHGKDKEKEAVLLAFRERGNILLATTVVEVGISLPRLTTVVIVGAERLGLATLHQLRGRVGRSGLESHCYLFSHAQDSERLKQFAQTTSGFEIAKLDLQFRDSGDLIDGTIQSGQKFKWLDMARDEAVIAYAQSRL